MSKPITISPKTIENAEFNDKISNFDSMLLRRREISRRIGEIDLEIRGVVDKYPDLQEGVNLEKAEVYKPKTQLDEDAWVIVDSMYGKHWMDTAVDPDVVRVLESRFKGITKFIELCHATYQENNTKRKRPIDEEATKSFQNEVKPLINEKQQLLLETRELETGIKDVEQYVDMFDKIARIGKTVGTGKNVTINQ